MDLISYILQVPLWALIAGAVAVLGIVWFIASSVAAFFIFTGPPDAFDVDIKAPEYQAADRKNK